MIKSLIILVSIIGIYYYLFKKFLEKFTNKEHIYFVIFCIIYLIIFYLLNHQQMFVYKVVKNMKDAEEKPLYDINNNFYKENQMVGLKNNLAIPQRRRRLTCRNPILQKIYIHVKKLYKTITIWRYKSYKQHWYLLSIMFYIYTVLIPFFIKNNVILGSSITKKIP